ncbi:MAG TPA: hypothetical protein VLI55_16865 [Bryobacteraceae bacterium]|nr:hypothetical protein [Bryobacteraceae bacterium]
MAIRFPRVTGYRVDLPRDRLEPQFTADSVLELTPALIGPFVKHDAGIIGEAVDLNLVHTGDLRTCTLLFHLTRRLLYTRWRDAGEEPEMALFHQLKGVAKLWLDTCLVCKGGTYPAQLMYQSLADIACDRITAAIVRTQIGTEKIEIILDSYNPADSTNYVAFNTSKAHRWETDARKCHVNWVILDSD